MDTSMASDNLIVGDNKDDEKNQIPALKKHNVNRVDYFKKRVLSIRTNSIIK